MTNKEIINLPVETKNGQSVGRVAEFEIDILTGKVANYHVKSSNVIKGLFKDELIINQSQVIGLTKEKMVVDDNVVTNGQSIKIKLSPEQAV
ncbi:MAG: PRC-barrel domain-containing protein [bacterium]